MNKFESAEYFARLRFGEYAKDHLKSITNIRFTPINGYDRYDVQYRENGKWVLAELKVRDYRHDEPFDGWLLEQDKYDALHRLISTDRAKINGTKIKYINFFKDDVTAIWDLTTLTDIKWYEKSYNKYKMKDAGDVIKIVTDLPLSSGTLYYNPIDTPQWLIDQYNLEQRNNKWNVQTWVNQQISGMTKNDLKEYYN